MNSKLFRGLILIIILLSCISNLFSRDELLEILEDELEREITELSSQEIPPYFISYSLSDVYHYLTSAAFGSLTDSNESRTRLLKVIVRVGDYSLDNTHQLRGDYMARYSARERRYLPIVIDDDADAIRSAIWQETNRIYRQAVEMYSKVKANIAVKIEEEDQSNDFSEESDIEEYYESPLNIDEILVNKTVWQEKVKQYTHPFLQNEDIYDGQATFEFTAVRNYFITTEGTKIIQNNTISRIAINSFIKSDDGMELPLYKRYSSFLPENLPDDEQVLTDVGDMIHSLQMLKKAAVVEPYTGPAILSGRAAGVFFHEIFGHRIEGHRLKREDDSQTFKKKIGEKVLPEFIDVIFDPSQKEFKGLDLLGYYQYDNEGIRGQKVTVVKSGILNDFLMSRSPIEGFTVSNGHGRAQIGYKPVSRQSNMFIQSSLLLSMDQLRDKLIEQCKSQGKEFGLFFKDIMGGFTLTGRYVPNSFNVIPMEVYKIYTDGRPDELVRGVDLVGTPLLVFSNIKATGDEWGVFNGTCGAESGGIPVSAIAPALLVSQVEVQKKIKSQERPPVLSRPDITVERAGKDSLKSEGNREQGERNPGDNKRNQEPPDGSRKGETKNQVVIRVGDDASTRYIILQAMKDELSRNMKELKLENLQKPFFISYTVRDVETMEIVANLGSIEKSEREENRSHQVRVMVGDYQRNDENYLDFGVDGSGNSMLQNADKIPMEDDYYGIRRALWIATDNVYKSAAEQFERKKAAIEQQSLPEQEAQLADFSRAPVIRSIEPPEKFAIDLSHWEDIARDLSYTFHDYTDIFASQVRIFFYQADEYFVNSEGSEIIRPIILAAIQIMALTQALDGENIGDHLLYYQNIPGELPSKGKIIDDIRKLAKNLTDLRSAPVFDDYYTGPVLFEHQAAAELFVQRLFNQVSGLVAFRKPLASDKHTQFFLNRSMGETLDKRMGKRIIARDLTIKVLPGLKEIAGQNLIGNYKIDAEGVQPPGELLLVENGILKTFLNDRIPTSTVKSSNGHQRSIIGRIWGNQNATGPSVVMVHSSNPVSEKRIKQQLIQLAKEEGLEYGLVVKKIQSPVDCSNLSLDLSRQSFGRIPSNENLVAQPIYVYKIFVKNGKEELVRAADFSAISVSSLRQMGGVSKEPYVYNILAPVNEYGRIDNWSGIPASFIVPGFVLLNELEVKMEQREYTSRLPVVSNPLE
jgi:predicted Zn-dependent protease